MKYERYPYAPVKHVDMLLEKIDKFGIFERTDIREQPYFIQILKEWFGDDLDLVDVERIVLFVNMKLETTTFYVLIRNTTTKRFSVYEFTDDNRKMYYVKEWHAFKIVNHVPKLEKLRNEGRTIHRVVFEYTADQTPVVKLETLGLSFVFRSVVGHFGEPFSIEPRKVVP